MIHICIIIFDLGYDIYISCTLSNLRSIYLLLDRHNHISKSIIEQARDRVEYTSTHTRDVTHTHTSEARRARFLNFFLPNKYFVDFLIQGEN